MGSYQVPQFIDIEDKIIGPLTLKQFMYLAGGGVLVFFSYFFLNLTFFIIFAVLIMSFSVALAFLKVQERPFPVFLKNFFVFLFKEKKYIWKKEEKNKF